MLTFFANAINNINFFKVHTICLFSQIIWSHFVEVEEKVKLAFFKF